MQNPDEKYQSAIYDTYDHDYAGDKTAGIIIRLNRRHINAPILDAGAGTGSLMMALEKKGYSPVEGIDLSPKHERIKKGSVTDLPFDNNSFATLFNTEVTEHLTPEQSQKAMQEFRRVLKPGGKLILTVPYKENPKTNLIICPDCGHQFHRYGHKQYFDEERISQLAESSGLHVISLKIYALGALAILPMARFYHFILKRLDYESNPKTMIVVAQKES